MKVFANFFYPTQNQIHVEIQSEKFEEAKRSSSSGMISSDAKEDMDMNIEFSSSNGDRE